MWIAKSNNWNAAIKPLERFAIERILQRCDYTEIISNKYRTTNGYTQLKELIHYCEVTLRRSKTVKTLMMIIEEANSPAVSQNILNDLIIEEYFQDLKEYFKRRIDSNKLVVEKMQPNLLVLENLYKDLRVFEKQLEERYFECLVIELKKINYDEEVKIHREIDRLSGLIDLLIPYLIFKGYSNATISEILRNWLRAGYPITVSKFLSFLHFKKRPFTFLQFLGIRSPESDDFLKLMRQGLEVEIEEIPAENLKTEFLEANNIPNEGIFAKYEFSTIDPHKHVRSNFDGLLKDLVIQKERQSLAVFNSFFDHSFWSNRSGLPLERFKTISLEGDPINVNVRGRTLRKTLEKASKSRSFEFTSETHLPLIDCEQLSNSVYYYNLALGSKSIENSLSLLWTALEAVQPYKVYSADIDAVQKLVSKGLGIGSIGRDINGFASRLHQFSSVNDNSLVGQFSKGFPANFYPDDLVVWFEWICDQTNCKSNFSVLKNHSELLAYQYLTLGKNLIEGQQSYLLDRINKSETSMKFQLQRIYHHRNKIVHSGDMINEYTNLWMHLEWYIGKILAYFIIKLHYEKSSNSLEDAFMELEADRDYLVSYLERNKDKKISGLSLRVLELIFKHNWQFF
jgi:hypothetical protein